MIDAACADAVLAGTGVSDYTGVYRDIFLIIQELVQAGIEPDPVAVLAKMDSSKGSPRQVVAELIDLTPTSANCQLYIEILVEQAKLNKVRQLGAELVQLHDAAGCGPMGCGGRGSAGDPERSAGLWDAGAVGAILCQAHQPAAGPCYLKLGIGQAGSAALRGTGGLHHSRRLSVRWQNGPWPCPLPGIRVRICGLDSSSLETREDKMFDRQVAMVTGISMGRIKRNQLDDDDWTRVADSAQGICKRMLDIVPAAGRSATEILNFAKARGYQVIYIDYIQLLRAENPGRPGMSRYHRPP